jgi:hypothetical protein
MTYAYCNIILKSKDFEKTFF